MIESERGLKGNFGDTNVQYYFMPIKNNDNQHRREIRYTFSIKEDIRRKWL